MTKFKKFKKKAKVDVYQKITDQVIKAIEGGTSPWSKPWNDVGMPMNYVTKKAYRGINVWITMLSGFSSPYWLTYNQAEKLGGNVIRGQKGTTVVFWQPARFNVKEEVDGVEETKSVRSLIMKSYTVFNAEQIEGVEFKAIPLSEIEDAPQIDKIIENMKNKPTFETYGNQAFYSPSFDKIVMPMKGAFKGQTEYYATLCHELIHSTGHTDRLNRATLMTPSFGRDHNYSLEELVAEMGASFLLAMVGLQPDLSRNSASYLKGWLKNLKGDKKFIFKAASAAQKAVDYITGTVVEYDNDDDKSQGKSSEDVQKMQSA